MEQDDERLLELLANLKVDSMNPDLWMEAASIYIAMGREEHASKAYQVSIKVVDPGKGQPQVLDEIRDLLWGDVVPSEADDRSSDRADVPDHATAEEFVTEGSFLAPQVLVEAAEGVPSSFASAEEALDQLRRELHPRGTVTCPDCNTLLESGDRLCYGCGGEIPEGEGTLEERVTLAQSRLAEDENDPDALFTLAAHLSVSGEHDDALVFLVRLTALNPRYPGLWWVKAKVFLEAGKPEAARASARMAREIWNEGHAARAT